MTLASGLVLGARGRARGAVPATVVVPPKASARAGYLTSRTAVVLRGILWAGLLLAACAIGSAAVAAVMFPAALIASVSSLRTAPDDGVRLTTAVTVGGPWLAAASLVVADAQGANLGLTLALLICVYDAACYLNGSGRAAGGRAGVTAGLLSVAVLAVFVAAVLVPPFTGVRPWVVVGVTGLFAPLGVLLAGRVRGWARSPALRRLDSMILAAPVWVILVALFVPR